MPDLFIKKIEIENFRCLPSHSVEFNTPDGTNEGSGLNVLIGENGNGKTSILEAVNYLAQSSYSIENKLSINDFADANLPITVKGYTDDFNCSLPFPGYFECNGVEVSAKSRTNKSPGKLLSSQFQVNGYFINKSANYRSTKGALSTKPILPLYKLFNNGNIENGEFSIFFFDKNRTRQISTGTFTTTFERICEDLNWKFAKAVDATTLPDLLKNISGEYFTSVLNLAQKGTGTKLATELCAFFGKTEFSKLKIDLLDLLHPFSQAFFALRDDTELKQIKSKALGSGIEMILTLLLLKSIAGESKGSVVYLIDEPELHLHPKAQDKLVELLMAESKTKQVILSTHSPYIFKNALNGNSRMIILKRDATDQIVCEYPNTTGWGKFPWSPSWGEINYHAFDLPTVEFHNELFGFIQQQNSLARIDDVDTHLAANGVLQTTTWIKERNGVVSPPRNSTLPYYVRNSIHHPENAHNAAYTQEQLKDSIEAMLPLA